jgi:outer membrane protein
MGEKALRKQLWRRVIRCAPNVAVGAVLAALPAWCQTAAPPPPPQAETLPAKAVELSLTLRDAVRLALKQSPAALLSRLQTAQRREQERLALAPLLPQAASDSQIYVNRYNLQEFLGRLQGKFLGNDNALRVGPYQVAEPGVRFSQQVLNLRALREYQASREDVRAAEADNTVTREDLVGAVVERYQVVLRAAATEAAAASRRDLATRLVEQAQQQLKSGTGTGIDLLRARVELANEQQRLVEAQAARRNATFVLTDLLDLPPGQEAHPVDALAFEELPAFDEEAELERALTTRPELVTLRFQQRAAELQTKGAREQRLPVLAFSGSFAEQGRTFSSLIPAYIYTGTVNIPVFEGGRIHAEVERAKLAEQQLRVQVERTQSQIREQVKAALSDLEAARAAVQTSDLGLQLAQQEVAQASRRFAAGVATGVEVTTAQDELARASDNRINALFQFNRARAELASATGQAEDVYAR